MSDLVLSHRKRFDSAEEAISAFYRRELPWLYGHRAYTWKFRQGTNQVIGHTIVTVEGVASISSEGDPVYLCRTPSDDLLEVEADVLMSKDQMLYKPDGAPSPYHEWFLQQKAERDRRQGRPDTGPIPVTVRMTF